MPRDAYGWKAFASVLMLVPALFLGASGKPVWKGDSFAAVRALVPPELWQPQLWAARLRAQWRDDSPRWLPMAMRLCPNPRLPAQLSRRFVRAPPAVLPADGAALLCAAQTLVLHLQQQLPAPLEAT